MGARSWAPVPSPGLISTSASPSASAPSSSTPGLLADTVPLSFVDGPGARFVAFLQGCPFDCVACHNPQTIPSRSPAARLVTAAALVEEIRAVEPYISGVTVSGGECTQQPAFVRELFERLDADAELHRLTRLLDSNGHATSEVWDALLPLADGVMLDLKALDPSLHVLLTGASNELVLASIRRVAAAGKLHEVRVLLIPGVNDDAGMVQQTAAWLLAVDPAIAVRVIGFRHHGTRRIARAWPDATDAEVAAAGALLVRAGLTAVT